MSWFSSLPLLLLLFAHAEAFLGKIQQQTPLEVGEGRVLLSRPSPPSRPLAAAPAMLAPSAVDELLQAETRFYSGDAARRRRRRKRPPGRNSPSRIRTQVQQVQVQAPPRKQRFPERPRTGPHSYSAGLRPVGTVPVVTRWSYEDEEREDAGGGGGLAREGAAEVLEEEEEEEEEDEREEQEEGGGGSVSTDGGDEHALQEIMSALQKMSVFGVEEDGEEVDGEDAMELQFDLVIEEGKAGGEDSDVASGSHSPVHHAESAPVADANEFQFDPELSELAMKSSVTEFVSSNDGNVGQMGTRRPAAAGHQQERPAVEAPPPRPQVPSLSEMLQEFVRNRNRIKQSNSVGNKWMYQNYDGGDSNVKEDKQALARPVAPATFNSGGAAAGGSGGVSDILVSDVYPPGFPNEFSTVAEEDPAGSNTCPSTCRCVCQQDQEEEEEEEKRPAAAFTWPRFTLASDKIDGGGAVVAQSGGVRVKPSAELGVALFPCARSAAYQLALALKLCRKAD